MSVRFVVFLYALCVSLLHANTIKEHFPHYLYVFEEFEISAEFADNAVFNRFAKKHRKPLLRFLSRSLDRGGDIVEVIRRKLLQNNMSDLFLYVAIAESGLENSAVSSAKAVGMWQFMEQTAKRFDLEVKEGIDRRKDPYLATEAAMRYFQTLHEVFGKWYLAVMAYNCGEGRLLKEIKRLKSDQIDTLISSRSLLPQETKEYVMKILLLALIGEKEHIMFLHIHPNNQVVSVLLESPISVENLSKRTGVSKATLMRLNPQFRSDTFSGNIYIPSEALYRFYLYDVSRLTNDTREDTTLTSYSVELGDTLESIAKTYGCSTDEIKRINALHRDYLIVGELLVVPSKR